MVTLVLDKEIKHLLPSLLSNKLKKIHDLKIKDN